MRDSTSGCVDLPNLVWDQPMILGWCVMIDLLEQTKDDGKYVRVWRPPACGRGCGSRYLEYSACPRAGTPLHVETAPPCFLVL